LSNSPGLGPVPERITVDAAQVRRLIEEQFPQWAGLRIEPVANGGWDNWTFHLGTDMVVRLPSAPEYAQAVEKEHLWLPVLAPRLPLPIPVPLAKGKPSADFPYLWSIYQWLDGVTAATDRAVDPVRFAVDLAGFLTTLQSVDAADGPQPGVHNWFRGGTLRTYDKDARRALEELDGHVDVGLAREIWANALDARWDGVDRWFHGDVAEGNLLLRDGQLAAVIDFGTCGVVATDPAKDAQYRPARRPGPGAPADHHHPSARADVAAPAPRAPRRDRPRRGVRDAWPPNACCPWAHPGTPSPGRAFAAAVPGAPRRSAPAHTARRPSTAATFPPARPRRSG
jgi:aminoglycoside phosphotransferase (APT) family kinase protein